MTTLEQQWRDLARDGREAAFKRVDDKHPLDLYVGLDPTGARQFLLLTDEEPPTAPVVTRGLELEKGHRSDGRWALTVSLRIPDLARLFSHLCEDLVESSRTGCRPADGGRFVVERISRWGRLLARSTPDGLNEQTFRGLVAELIVLERDLFPLYGSAVAVAGWYGPLDADQDFRMPDRLVEVKSSAAGSLAVTISSAEQLDVHGHPLVLAAVPLSVNSIHGETLKDLVASIREQIGEDSDSLDTFNERLGITGYDPADPLSSRTFSVGSRRYYIVRAGFPRIVRSSLEPAMISVRYQLDLAMCREFEVLSVGA